MREPDPEPFGDFIFDEGREKHRENIQNHNLSLSVAEKEEVNSEDYNQVTSVKPLFQLNKTEM